MGHDAISGAVYPEVSLRTKVRRLGKVNVIDMKKILTMILIFVLVLAFGSVTAFAAGEARKIYHVYAKKNADSSYAPDTGLREIPKSLLKSMLSPAVAVCLTLWLVMAIVNLF